MEVRETVQSDLDYVCASPLDPTMKRKTMPLTKPAYTVLIDGKIMGCGGVALFWAGVGEAWVVMIDEVINHKLTAYRCCKEILHRIETDHKLRRIQATVRTDFAKAIAMVEMLGFQRECVMKSYCPDGTDSYLYSRVNNV